MERHLLERLIGAGVLVLALVVIVPAILNGDSDDDAGPDIAVSTSANEPRRTHTIRPDRSTQAPPVARVVAAPDADSVAGSSEKDSSGSEPEPERKPEPEPERKPAQSPSAVEPPAPKPAAVAPAAPKKTRAPVAAPVASTPVPESGWAVQLGSFSSRENAQKLADEVGGRGFPVFLMAVDRAGKKLYRVRVGPRETRAQATELAGRLKKAGYPGQVTQ